jgi:hypothetical protein
MSALRQAVSGWVPDRPILTGVGLKIDTFLAGCVY